VFGWLLQSASRAARPGLEHYQAAFQFLLAGVALAILLTFTLKETGAAVRAPVVTPEVA
jgi:hypothetical protein